MADDAQEVADILDALSSPTPNEAYEAVREYDTRPVIGAVAAKAQGGGPGGSGPVELLGPYTVNHDTAGFFDAADNGMELATIAAGSRVRVVGCATIQLAGTTDAEIDVVLATGAATGASFLAVYDAADNPSGAADGAYREMPPLAGSPPALYGFASVQSKIYVGLYGTGTPNAGQFKFYIETTTATAP